MMCVHVYVYAVFDLYSNRNMSKGNRSNVLLSIDKVLKFKATENHRN